MADVKGLDVSHWTYPTQWDNWKALEFKFVYIKVTEGTGWVDNKWEDHFNEAANLPICATSRDRLALSRSEDEARARHLPEPRLAASLPGQRWNHLRESIKSIF